MKIKLQQVIEAVESADDAMTTFYDTQTGDTVALIDELYFGETDEALAELIENSPGRFLRFPTKYEIHEYSIMESFVDSLPAGAVRDDLASAIRGRGAFRRFKQSIRYHGIEQSWYDYQAEAYQRIAIRWCRDNDLELEDTTPPAQLQRVAHMEQLLGEATAALSALGRAVADYRAAQGKIAELQRYYESGQWMEDFNADKTGKLPASLPRGVLSEDAIYDLLTEQARLRESLGELSGDWAQS